MTPRGKVVRGLFAIALRALESAPVIFSVRIERDLRDQVAGCVAYMQAWVDSEFCAQDLIAGAIEREIGRMAKRLGIASFPASPTRMVTGPRHTRRRKRKKK